MHLRTSTSSIAKARASCTPAAMMCSYAYGSFFDLLRLLLPFKARKRDTAYVNAAAQVRNRHRTATLCLLQIHAMTCVAPTQTHPQTQEFRSVRIT